MKDLPARGVARPSRSERARAHLLAAALEIFGQKGARGATVRNIARAAGQNVASIAYYFGSKEHLYRAVIEGIVQEVRVRLADVIERIQTARRAGPLPPDEALRLLQDYFRAVYLRLLSRSDIVGIGRLVVREQMQPTPAFEILYEQGFREIHEMLCCLVAAVAGGNPRDRRTILRTHALLGQVYFFVTARETILRRMGWKDMEGRRAEWVADVLCEHVAVLLTGLADRPRPNPNASST